MAEHNQSKAADHNEQHLADDLKAKQNNKSKHNESSYQNANNQQLRSHDLSSENSSAALKNVHEDVDLTKLGQTTYRQPSITGLDGIEYHLQVNSIVMTGAQSGFKDMESRLKAVDQMMEDKRKRDRLNHQQLVISNQLTRASTINLKLKSASKDGPAKPAQKKQAIKQTQAASTDKTSEATKLEQPAEMQTAENQVVDKTVATNQAIKQEQKHQVVRDVQNQQAGIDANNRIHSLNDQADQAMLSVNNAKTNDGSGIDLAPTMGTGKTESNNTPILTDNSDAVGSVSMNDGLSINLLNDIQTQIEADSAETNIVEVSGDPTPVVDVTAHLAPLPDKILDQNGFRMDLSKKDKQNINKRFNKLAKRPFKIRMPVTQFRRLVIGNNRKIADVRSLKQKIISSQSVDLSPYVNQKSPLIFNAPLDFKQIDERIAKENTNAKSAGKEQKLAAEEPVLAQSAPVGAIAGPVVPRMGQMSVPTEINSRRAQFLQLQQVSKMIVAHEREKNTGMDDHSQLNQHPLTSKTLPVDEPANLHHDDDGPEY